MKITVRATRAYLAGFGTSGSLLAGAAALFVLGSAIVAFNGWPQIATGPATVAVTAAARPAGPSHVTRRLAAVLRARLVTGGASVGPAAGNRRTAAVRGTGASRVSISSIGTPASGVAAAPGGSSASCSGSACTRPAGSSGLVSQLANTVAQEVTTVGSNVGSRLSSGSGAVAGSLSGASPQAASAVQNTGSNAGNAISGTATNAADTVTQVGNALGGGH
jgi:hypothetical protein